MTHTISRYLTVVTSTALLVILGAASGRATLAIESESRAQGLPGNGRSKTLLPDDGVLFAGGRNAEGVVTAEARVVRASGLDQPFALLKPRTGHTATVMADGRVLVWVTSPHVE